MNQTSITKITLCIAIGLPVLLLGAVHPQTLGVVLFLTAILFGLLGIESKITLDFVGWTFLGLIALTAFQLVPLPIWLVDKLSPESVQMRQSALELAGAPPANFLPVTVDIPVTLNELAKLFFYLSIYWTIKHLAVRNSTRFVLYAISSIGFVGAVILLWHKIVMARHIYGFYLPVQKVLGENDICAPLVNANHMSAFLGLCSFVSIGLAASVDEREKRLWFVAFGGITGGALLLTLSRGGIAAFVGGQLVFVTMMVLRNVLFRKSSKFMESSRLPWVPLGLAVSLGLGMMAANEAIIGEYLDGNVEKLGMWKEALPLLERFPWVGAGRGGFGTVFPLVSSWASRITFTHAENVIVQVLVDYGILLGPLVLLAFAIAIARRILAIPIRATTTSMVAALIAVGIHNLVDFNLEIPGVAAVAMAILAVLTVSRRNDMPVATRFQAVFPRTGQFVLATVSLLLCGALWLSLPPKQAEVEVAAAEDALAGMDASYFSTRRLSSVMYRHPADWYLFFLVGMYHSQAKDTSPLPFWGQAVRLNPHAGAPHYYIGKFLLEHGYAEQGMMEFRLAVNRDERYLRPSAQLLVHGVRAFTQLLSWAVTDNEKRLFYDALAEVFVSRGDIQSASLLDRRVLRFTPPTRGALIREARRLTATDPRRAMELAKTLRKMENGESAGVLLEAEIAFQEGRNDEAVQILEGALSSLSADDTILRALAWAYQRAGRHDRAIATAQRIQAGVESVPQRVSAVCFEGELEAQEGNTHLALARYRQALAMAPNDIEVVKKILALARNMGDAKLEMSMLRRLQAQDPKGTQWNTAVDSIENDINEKDLNLP